MINPTNKFRCPLCKSTNVRNEVGYSSIFRCSDCSYLGTRNDFDLRDIILDFD